MLPILKLKRLKHREYVTIARKPESQYKSYKTVGGFIRDKKRFNHYFFK